jgi:tetratricopeptide (TPR) repeat protein
MSSDKEYYDLIEGYLLGALDEEARRKFEERMAGDREMQKEVELQRSLMYFLQDAKGLELRRALDDADQNFAGKTVPLVRKVLPWAAAIALVIVGVGLAFWDFSPQAQASLFETYFEPYPMVLSQRSGDASMQSLIAAYESGRYGEALGHIEQWASDSVLSAAGTFYQGMCLLALGEGQRAAAALQKVIDRRDPLFTTQAQWYLALAHLQSGHKPEARALFETIAETPGHYKSDAAARVLGEME